MSSDKKYLIRLGGNAFALAVASSALAAPALAQQGASQGLEEIVVTARRTEESLQQTPVAVTALSAERLALAQIVDTADIQRTTPNLTIATGAPASPGFAVISMRGQSNLNANSASDPAIGIYIDGVYIARAAGSLLDLEDAERVEVLRGPQGTLFGRSTTGGAISVTTQKPTDSFEGVVSAEVGNYNHRSFRGMLNLPLVDERLAARVNYKYTDRDGYAENKLLGQDLNDMQDNQFVRGQLKYTDPSGNWDLNLAADYNEYKTGGQMIGVAGINPIGPAAAIPGLINQLNNYVQTSSSWYDNYGQQVTQTYPGWYPHEAFEAFGYSATLNVDLGFAQLESITAYRELDTFGSNDLDGTPIGLIYSMTEYTQDQISQELKFSGDLSDRLSWVGGVYYFKETGDESSISQAFQVFNTPPTRNLGDVESTSKAVYGQLYYNLTDDLRLTAGYRKTWDERIAVIKNKNPFLPVEVCSVPAPQRDDGVTCRQTREVKFDYPAYVVGVDYQLTDDIFLYANTSEASMSGGWNLRLGSAPAFEPEENRAMEVGIKADWLDSRLRTNLAIFRNKGSDVQRVVNTVFDAGFGPQTTSFVNNAGDTVIDGAELEITALPWEGMTLTAAIGFSDGEYESGSFKELQRVNAPTTTVGCTPAPGAGTGRIPATAVDCEVDRSGEIIPTLPEWTFSFAATQVVPTQLGELTLHADYSFIDEQVFAPSSAATQQPAAVQAAYAQANRYNTMDSRTIVNAKASLAVENTGFTVSLWGRNLGDEQYVSRPQDFYVGLGLGATFVGDPRTYGVTVDYRFE